MSDERVETELRGSVLWITLADEERRNALNPELVSDLVAALDAADADPAVRVVVLSNRGSVFCAGANLRADRSEPATPVPPGLYTRFARSPKPYVGRIAGHCVAGGVGLAAAVDICVAADDVLFGFTEVRVGVAPAMISVVCLPKLRTADARQALLRGRRFPAAEAARIGLIATAVPRDGLDAEVDAVVGDLLAGGPIALGATKQLLDRVPHLPVDEASAWTAQLSAELFSSAEAREGMAAYVEKRPAAWRPLPGAD